MRVQRLLFCVVLTSVSVAATAIGGWEAAWSPDGRQIAFTSASPHGIANIWIVDCDGTNLRQLTALGGRAPQWVSNTRKIVFVTLRGGRPEYYVTEPDAQPGSEVPLPGVPEGAQGIVWSPDASQVAFALPGKDGKSRDLWVASSDGSNARGLTTNFWVRQYAWSADGTRLVVVVGRAIGSSLWIVDPETKQISLLYQGFCSSPSYSPDGKHIAFAVPAKKEDHRLVCLDVATGRKRPVPVRSFDGKTIRWSPDGSRIIFSSETRTDAAIWTAGLVGRDLVRVTPTDVQAFDPSFSPDGTEILFSAASAQSHGVDLYTCAAGASVPFGAVRGLADKVSAEDLPRYTRLTESQPASFSPAWSPDSKSLAIAVINHGSGTIYLLDERGRTKKRLTEFDPGLPLRLVWSPDSSRVAIVEGSTIRILSRSGRTEATIQTRGEATAAWSPDSRSTYLTEWREGRAGVSVFELGSKEPRQLTRGSERQIEAPAKKDTSPGAPAEPHAGLGVAGPVPTEEMVKTVQAVHDLYPACSPDGANIAFVRDNQVWVMTAEGKDERQLTNLTPPESGETAIYDPAWSPDGKRILFQVGRMQGGELAWQTWTVDVGSGQTQLVTSNEDTSEYLYFLRKTSGPPAFAPDGAILFTSVREGLATVTRAAGVGAAAEPLSGRPGSYGSLSRTGKLAYVSFEAGEERVKIRDLPTGVERAVACAK